MDLRRQLELGLSAASCSSNVFVPDSHVLFTASLEIRDRPFQIHLAKIVSINIIHNIIACISYSI
jgi:hypothetical protein